MTEEDLLAFMAGCRLGVLGSVWEHRPQAALVGIAVTPGLEIIFDTLDSSRKYRNLTAQPACSFVLGWPGEKTGEQTVQYEGTATILSGTELPPYREIYLKAWPECATHLSWPGIAYIVVRPRWIRFSDYERNPPFIREFTFADSGAPPGGR